MNTYKDEVLMHYGIKGQKKGRRRFQNPDGSLTAAGKLRYLDPSSKRNTGSYVRLKNSGRGKDVIGTTNDVGKGSSIGQSKPVGGSTAAGKTSSSYGRGKNIIGKTSGLEKHGHGGKIQVGGTAATSSIQAQKAKSAAKDVYSEFKFGQMALAPIMIGHLTRIYGTSDYDELQKAVDNDPAFKHKHFKSEKEIFDFLADLEKQKKQQKAADKLRRESAAKAKQRLTPEKADKVKKTLAEKRTKKAVTKPNAKKNRREEIQ